MLQRRRRQRSGVSRSWRTARAGWPHGLQLPAQRTSPPLPTGPSLLPQQQPQQGTALASRRSAPATEPQWSAPALPPPPPRQLATTSASPTPWRRCCATRRGGGSGWKASWTPTAPRLSTRWVQTGKPAWLAAQALQGMELGACCSARRMFRCASRARTRHALPCAAESHGGRAGAALRGAAQAA